MPQKSRKAGPTKERGKSTSRGAEIDRYVGTRIRERRIMMGLSQKQMADHIGVTSQQTHKYEHAINRISAGRLYEIAHILRVPLSYFFEGLGDRPEEGTFTRRQRLCLQLAQNFSQITDERQQEAVNQLVRTLISE